MTEYASLQNMIRTIPAHMELTTHRQVNHLLPVARLVMLVRRETGVIEFLNIGNYCPSRGASNVAGLCTPGYYCASQSSFKMPSKDITISMVDYFLPAYGGYCMPG